MRLLLLSALCLMPLAAQEPAPPAGEHKHPAPKNLKLLPAENLIPTMRSFSAALGVECSFCHVQGDFASDEKHTKEIARHMIGLAKEINGHFPDGKTHVTCYTCHRGAEEPAMEPAK